MEKLAIGALLILTGCMVGPNYHKPEVSMPNEFAEKDTPLAAAEEGDLATWWKQFNDPLLDELIAEAIQGNFDLKIAQEKIEELRGLYRIQRSYLFPEVVGNASATRSQRSLNASSFNIVDTGGSNAPGTPFTNFIGPRIQNLYDVEFDASWEIDLFGKLRRAKEAAWDDVQAAQENERYVQITVIADVVRNYIGIRAFQERIKNLEKHIAVEKELTHLTQERMDAGLNNGIDLGLAQSLLEENQAQLPPLKRGLKETIYALAVLLGKQPEVLENAFASQEKIPSASGKVPVGLPSTLLQRRPDIRKVERELASATAQIGVAKGDLFPVFSLIGSFGYLSNFTKNLFAQKSQEWLIGPTMSWPLFQGGRVFAQIDAATSREKQALFNYQKTVLTALEDVETALAAYFQENERLHRLIEKVSSNADVTHWTRDRFTAGLNDFSSVLAAEADLLAAEEERILSTQTLMVSLASLYKALGGGW